MDFSLETQNKPLCALSGFSYIPTRRNEAKEMSYFNRDSKVTDVTTYDQVFHQAEGYDQKLKQDNRKHWKGRGLDIYQEEKSRPVPVRSSSEYGRHVVPSINQTNRPFVRVETMKAEFYRKDGISLAEGYGSVVPS